jgi:hypothetical protein
MQRARHGSAASAASAAGTIKYDDEPGTSRRRCILSLHGAAPQAPAHQAPPEQDYYEQPQPYADEPQQDPSRYDDAPWTARNR